MKKDAERITVDNWEKFPTRESMPPAQPGKREKPSSDQRKVRRRMKRQQRRQANVEVPSEHWNRGDAVLREWASKERMETLYHTADRPGLLAIRAQQVLDYLEDK